MVQQKLYANCEALSKSKTNVIIIIKNECHSNIIADRLQGGGHSKKLRESESVYAYA